MYERSLAVLERVAQRGRSLVKTGWMLGLGETAEEVHALLDQVAASGVDTGHDRTVPAAL